MDLVAPFFEEVRAYEKNTSILALNFEPPNKLTFYTGACSGLWTPHALAPLILAISQIFAQVSFEFRKDDGLKDFDVFFYESNFGVDEIFPIWHESESDENPWIDAYSDYDEEKMT